MSVPTPVYRYVDLRRSDEDRMLKLEVTSDDGDVW